MHRSTSSLLTRLRRHRGLWVLVVAVMLIRLVAGTVCLADASGKRFVLNATLSAPSVLVDAVIAEMPADDANACLLGEVGDCHCACAHMVTLPMTSMTSIARMEARFDTVSPGSAFAPATPESLLRPPLA